MTLPKLISTVLALGVTLSSFAKADVVTNFNLKDGAGTTIVAGADGLDWSERGSSVNIGIGPFSDFTLLPPGGQFDYRYQASLAAVSGGNPTANLLGLDTTSDGIAQASQSYEFTIVAKMREVITASAIVGGSPTAFFGIAGTNAENKVAIFYDPAHNANTATGTGFDDGILIAYLTVTQNGTSSQFKTIPGTGAGTGSSTVSAKIVEAGDFINAFYLEGVGNLLNGLTFSSTINYPAGTSTTNGFHLGGSELFADYTVGANDIVFKNNGDNQFTAAGAAVPEPGTLVLLSIAVIGLVAARSRSGAKRI
jgi:hypothetical protein